MTQHVSSGSDVSAGTYRCSQCANELSIQSVQSLPPVLSAGTVPGKRVSGGDQAS